jgi:transposase
VEPSERVVLLAAKCLRNDQIADRLNAGRDVIRKWRKRFFEERLDGLEELPRSGRPDVPPGRGGRDQGDRLSAPR